MDDGAAAAAGAAVDAAAFADDAFDAAGWVNAALGARKPEEPLDMHVGELLMRMQLLAQDVQYNLRDASDLAMMNLPKSQREIEMIQADAASLQAQTDRLKQQLEANLESSDAPRIAALTELDTIKSAAEDCVEKLNEAEKLDNLRLQVEDAFRADDLAQMAQSIGAFRSSLVRPRLPRLRSIGAMAEARCVCTQAVVGELRQGKLYAQNLEEWVASLEAKVSTPSPPLLRRPGPAHPAPAAGGSAAERVDAGRPSRPGDGAGGGRALPRGPGDRRARLRRERRVSSLDARQSRRALGGVQRYGGRRQCRSSGSLDERLL